MTFMEKHGRTEDEVRHELRTLLATCAQRGWSRPQIVEAARIGVIYEYEGQGCIDERLEAYMDGYLSRLEDETQ